MEHHSIDVEINNVRIPALGFGTFQLDEPVAERMVKTALDLGYRHIDTAQVYRNEAAVGRGIAASGVAREEIFLTTKVWIDRFRDGDLQQSVDESLRRLQTDYVDLLLLHWPNPQVPLAETIAALNAVQETGKARLIGISNFTCALIDEAARHSRIPLATNQVEYHPYLDQSAVLDRLHQHHMTLTAYSPLAQGKLLNDPVLTEIGNRYGKNAGQVALRWLIQQPGVLAIPRSSQTNHAQSNFEIFDFALTTEELQAIHRLARPDGRVINPQGLAPDWD